MKSNKRVPSKAVTNKKSIDPEQNDIPVKPQPPRRRSSKWKPKTKPKPNPDTTIPVDSPMTDDDDPEAREIKDNEQSTGMVESKDQVMKGPGLDALLGVTKIAFFPTLPYILLEDLNLNRHFQISDQSGKKIYHCGERANSFCEVFQGFRPFHLFLFNSSGEIVVEMKQSCSFLLCLLRAECAGGKVQILLKSGETLGMVSQLFTCCTPKYEVIDHEENKLATIVGKCCSVCFRCDAKSFRVFADVKRDEEVSTELIATIGKRYLEFKDDMSVEMKCLLLGASFLIEMDYFRSCRGIIKVFLLFLVIIAVTIFVRFYGLQIFKKYCPPGTNSTVEDGPRACITP